MRLLLLPLGSLCLFTAGWDPFRNPYVVMGLIAVGVALVQASRPQPKYRCSRCAALCLGRE